MATIADPAPRHSDTSTVDQHLIISEATSLEQIAAVQMAEELIRVSAPIRGPNVLVRLAESLVALNDWLSGPAMSKRDSLYRDIAEEDRKRIILAVDYWRP